MGAQNAEHLSISAEEIMEGFKDEVAFGLSRVSQKAHLGGCPRKKENKSKDTEV